MSGMPPERFSLNATVSPGNAVLVAQLHCYDAGHVAASGIAAHADLDAAPPSRPVGSVGYRLTVPLRTIAVHRR
jgi:hypothetical protein